MRIAAYTGPAAASDAPAASHRRFFTRSPNSPAATAPRIPDTPEPIPVHTPACATLIP